MPKKSANEKTVAVIFTIPAVVKATLYKKIRDGGRSRFVTEVLARELGVALPKAGAKKAPAAKKTVAKAPAGKKGGLFNLFK